MASESDESLQKSKPSLASLDRFMVATPGRTNRCSGDRNAQDWDVFTMCPVMPWIYTCKNSENPDHVKDKRRSNRQRMTSLVRTARQRRYAASKTNRNLWNLGRPTVTRKVWNRPRKADYVHEDQIEAIAHTMVQRDAFNMIRRTISASRLLTVWLIFLC